MYGYGIEGLMTQTGRRNKTTKKFCFFISAYQLLCVPLPRNLNITKMENLDDYRQQILQCLLAAVNTKGEQRYTEEQAQALLNELTEEELLDGIDFNSPEEIAQLLMESGL